VSVGKTLGHVKAVEDSRHWKCARMDLTFKLIEYLEPKYTGISVMVVMKMCL
jgi:hypothetical protein